MFNHECQNVGGDVSVRSKLVLLVLVKILVQDLDNWQWCLIVFAQGDVVGDALAVIFEDTIEVHEAEEEQVGVASHILNDIEQAIEHVFRDFFFLSVVEELSLRVLVGLQINGNVLCSVLLDDTLLLETLDAKNYVVCRRQQNFLSLLMSIWSIGKVTAVKYNQVLELIATTSTTGTHSVNRAGV